MPIKPDLKWPKEAWILGQDVSVGFTSTMLFKLLEILCNFNPSKLTLSNRSKISIRSPESSDKEIHACETNPKRNTNKIHRECEWR
uniref:Uncharacterized protein n=1 Tax=Glycine max TaxID=3847 RepID=A0A0R0GBS9_SOYBN